MMIEFSGWIRHDRSPRTTPATGGETGFWNRPGNIVQDADTLITFGDGTSAVDPAHACVRTIDSGRLAAVFTGLVLNAPQLRSALRVRGHQVSDHGWADLVVAAFQEWGIAFAERLEGTFAIALLDTEGRLHLVRDRLAVKPLYYAEYDGGFVFSTHAGRVLDHPRIEPWMSEEGLLLALSPRLVTPGETPLANVYEIKPGHTVLVSDGRVVENCYWRLESTSHTDSPDQTRARVRRLLEDSVAAHLTLDPEAGVMMSGGMDSTAVAGLAAMLRDRGDTLRTYSLELEGDDTDFRPSALRPEPDGPYAKLAARELGTDHRAIRLTTAQLIDATEEAREARGMPGWGQFDTSWLVLAKAIRQERATVLTGSFSDEIFGGYPWYHDPAVLAADAFPWQGNAPRVWTSLTPDFIKRVNPSHVEQERYHALLEQVPRLAGDSPEEARMKEALFLSLQGPTIVNLARGDRMSNAADLATPSPYMDHNLVQYVWNVPWHMKNRPPGWKFLLRAAIEDVVPQAVLNRPKSGYPGTHDPAYAKQTMETLTEIANNPSAPLYPFMDQVQLKQLTTAAEHTMTFTNAAHMLIPVVETNTWMARFGIQVR
jgi:asparagine synthase (glutamine-hydrolysing)